MRTHALNGSPCIIKMFSRREGFEASLLFSLVWRFCLLFQHNSLMLVNAQNYASIMCQGLMVTWWSRLASFPGPAQISIAFSTVKRERAWYLIERMVERVWLCVGALGPEQRKEPRYKVAYHTYLASGRQLSYTLSVERIVDWKYAKCSLLVRQIFATCQLHHAHMRKDTRLSPLFCTASDGKLGGAWERG